MRTASDQPLLKALATEIKARRSALGISQEELAFSAGLNRTFVGKLEIAASQPGLTSLFRIAEALRVSPGALLDSVSHRYAKESKAAPKRRVASD